MSGKIKITSADRLFVLTGAGVSAESGVPTFRDSGGWWDGLPPEQLSSPEAFEEDPALVWKFYSMRRSVAAGAVPNPGHFALSKVQDAMGARFTLCTQNVDSLHELSGSREVLHIHGKLFESRCADPACVVPAFVDDKLYEIGPQIPRCRCGALVRPNIVWFGEATMHYRDIVAALARCSIFLAVGTSGTVFPAAQFAKSAKQQGATTIYVGLEEPSNVEWFDQVALGPSGRLLPNLLRIH